MQMVTLFKQILINVLGSNKPQALLGILKTKSRSWGF